MLLPVTLALASALSSPTPSGERSQETFEVPGGLSFAIYGSNDLGEVVGQVWETSTTWSAFHRSPAGEVRYFEARPGIAGNTAFNDVTNSGELLLAAAPGPFLLAGGAYQPLPDLGGTVTYGGRNGSGLYVGAQTTGLGSSSPVLYDGALLTSVNVPGFAVAWLGDVNAGGVAVGSCGPDFSGFSVHGLVYDSVSGVTTLLDVPGADSTFLYGINDAGEMVGGALLPGDTSLRAFHYDGQSFELLDIFGRTGESRATCIDNTGRIVGTYLGQHLGQDGTFGFFLTDSGPQPYCQANANSSGEAAAIHAAGSTSVAANDLVLQAGPAPANAQGMFFYGLGRQELPFGNGFLCVAGSLARLGSAPSNAAGFALSRFGLGAAPGLTPGTRIHAQYWFRDVAAGGAGFNTSRGLTLELTP